MRQPVPTERLEGLLNNQRGLKMSEVEQRRGLYGSNHIVERATSGWSDILRDTVRDPMVWFLSATAMLFAWLGDYTEAAVLALALLPIAGMDAYLHRRTQASTEGLAGHLASRASVIRNERVADIAASELVPGDLAIVQTGTPFPADGIILTGENLQTDESTLTGESFPVRKRPPPYIAAGSGASVESESWGSAGTRLLTGEARLRVVYIGGETLYGQIVRAARAGQHQNTPLQRAIGRLVVILVVASAAICVVLGATRYFQGYGILDAFVSAVTLAVAALPEEFPVVFTFFLGVGVYRLARRQALVRRSVVVENIGRVSCICSDKTGTMTEGRLRLTHVIPAAGTPAQRLLDAALAASRAESGDPLDLALLGQGEKRAAEILATFPFTEDRRRETAILRTDQDTVIAAVKGAPETVLSMSGLEGDLIRQWQHRMHELATEGHKLIACAERRLAAWDGSEPETGYEFLGLLAFEDPPREGVAEAIAQARSAGIRVIMVTGDHPATARAIAVELGIGGDAPAVIEGPELERRLKMPDGRGLEDIDVVARAVPAQKLSLVKALQNAGEIVAVTGDGVNDTPALQGADVGIAMGLRGTKTAREVASIVLLDDNFRTIVRAIAEGRQLFRNIKLSFAYLLMMHLPLVATAAIVPFAGFPLLYLPVHIVWLELIIHPTAMLVFQGLPDLDTLEPVVRTRRLRFFNGWEWSIVCVVAVMIACLVLFSYDRSLGSARDVEHARTMALVALIVASATLTAGLNRWKTRSGIVAGLGTVASAVLLTELRPLAEILHLSPLHFDDWLLAAAGGIVAGILSAVLPLAGRAQRPAGPARR